MSGPFDRESEPILEADIESMRDGHIWGLFPISMQNALLPGGLFGLFRYVGPGLLCRFWETASSKGVGEGRKSRPILASAGFENRSPLVRIYVRRPGDHLALRRRVPRITRSPLCSFAVDNQSREEVPRCVRAARGGRARTPYLRW